MTPKVNKCTICGAETELFVNGRPLCVACASPAKPKRVGLTDERAVEIHLQLEEAERTARADLDSALTVFGEMTSRPVAADAVDRARKALSEIGRARAKYQDAHRRLLDFVLNGVVPDDLKRSD